MQLLGITVRESECFSAGDLFKTPCNISPGNKGCVDSVFVFAKS